MKSHSTLLVSELTVLITGGARGIGAATAALLAQEGANILLTDVLDDEGERLADSLGPTVFYRHLDVTDETHWQQAVAEAQERFGRLDALFNNAGVVSFESVDQTSPEAFRKVLDINLFGVFLGFRLLSLPCAKRAVGSSSTPLRRLGFKAMLDLPVTWQASGRYGG